MIESEIPKYTYNNTSTSINFEIIPLEKIFNKAPKSSQKPHRLDFHQIIYITKGEGTHNIDFKPIAYCPNTIIPVAMGQVQQFNFNENINGYAILFKPDFLITDENTVQHLYDFIIFNHLVGKVSITSNSLIENHFNIMLEMQNQTFFFNKVEFLRNTLKNYLILLEREKRNQTSIKCDASLHLYHQFIKELELNLNYTIKVSKICEILHTSPKQLNAAIKLYTNTTAKEYIEERIILESKRLLVYSNLSIKEVAYQIGFDDPSNFTKYFKKHTGQIPNNYKQNPF